MKRILLFFFIIAATLTAKASHVYPLPVTITQSDGTTLTVVGHGDEHLHWFTTTDGVLLCRVGTDFFVAATTTGDLVATKQLAHEPSMRTEIEKQLIAKQNKDLFINYANSVSKAKREPVVVNSTFLPHTGNPKVLVILADFKDVNFKVADPVKTFEQYLNGTGRPVDFGNREDRNYGSVAQYFDDMSYGAFRPKFDIYGPIRLPHNLVHYGEGKNDRMDQFLPDVINTAKAELNIDFDQYDTNGDGFLDLVYVIYAGYAASITQNSSDCIWPKSGNREVVVKDGLKTSRYGVSNELNAYPNAFKDEPYERVNGIGLFCHEFSHCMGLPDFYPTVDANKVDNQSMEYWSLMDSGEYLDNGWCPAAYTAWEREAFGWMEIETLTESKDKLQIKSIDADGGKAYKILNDNDETGNEYFIIENIQQQKWNTKHKGHGLLVYHVNYNQANFNLPTNNVNNTLGYPNMTVVPADGLLASVKNIGKVVDWGTGENGKVTNADYYAQLAGDLFPGTSYVSELNETMALPNYKVYSGETLNKALANISEEDGVITLDFISDYEGYLTKLDCIQADEYTDDNVYTLDGRIINSNNLTKGIYIYKGKKTVIK